ncbi:MAG TPA: hypothetical protein VH083_07010 [Myxococcales bacterium]|nr:hypothetical protein [Myxococcales bacterium]
MRLSRSEIAVVALALVGLCRAGYFHLVAEPRFEPPRAHLDERFRRLKSLLPAQGPVGYLSDALPAATQQDDPAAPGTRLYEEAQFALAPLLLRNGDDQAQTVVAVLQDPAGLAALVRKHGLRVVAEAGPGLAVLGK